MTNARHASGRWSPPSGARGPADGPWREHSLSRRVTSGDVVAMACAGTVMLTWVERLGGIDLVLLVADHAPLTAAEVTHHNTTREQYTSAQDSFELYRRLVSGLDGQGG